MLSSHTHPHELTKARDTLSLIARWLTVFLLLMIWLHSHGWAQAIKPTGNTVMLHFNGAPSGTCLPFYVATDDTNGDFYNCFNGAWVKVNSAAGGTGTVTSFSAGNLPPLFTSSVATATTTPALTFALSNAAANTVYGNNTGGSAVPGFQSLVLSQLPGSGAATVNTSAPLGGGGSLSLGGTLSLTCTGCLTSVTGHNLLSLTHPDTVVHTPVRGDLIAGNSTPAWAAVARGGTNIYPKWNSSGDVVPSSLAASGVGSCGANQFETGDNADAAPTCVQPAFTNISGTATAAQEPSTTVNSVVNDTNVTGSIAAQVLTLGWAGTLAKGRNLATAVYTDQPNIFGTGFLQTFELVQQKRFSGLGWVDASGEAGADFGAKIAASIADLPSTGGIVDATKFSGQQTISTDFYNTPKCVTLLLGNGVVINSAVQMNYATCTSFVVATPAAPVLTGSGTGGTFTNASATTLFVKITYVLDGDSNRQTLPSSESSLVLNSNGCTAGLTACSATVTSPASATAATAYNVYVSTATGTEKLANTLGPVPVGVNYVITTNGAGAVVPVATTAYYGFSGIVGAGRGSTIIHLQPTLGFFTSGCCQVNNFFFRDLSITQEAGGLGQGKIACFGCDNFEANNIEFSGGANSLYLNGPTNSRLLHLKFTDLQDGAGYADINADSFTCNHLVIDDLTINGGRPTVGSFALGFGVNNCSNVNLSNAEADFMDGSNRTSYAAMGFNGVQGFVITNVISHDHMSADGFALLGNNLTGASSRMTQDGSISGYTAYNNGTVHGIGTNNGNGDGLDMQEVRNITATGITLKNNGGSVDVPNFECYYCTDITLNGLNATEGQGGMAIVSAQNVTFNGGVVNNNKKSGVSINPNTTVVNTVGTAVTWVSGGAFGPWRSGKTVVINVGGVTPTAFKVASVTDFHNLVLQSGPANQTGQNMTVDDENVTFNGTTANENGQTLVAGDANRAGFYINGAAAPGGASIQLNGVTASDLQASPTQSVGAVFLGGSRGVINGFSAIGNAGAATANCSGIIDICFATATSPFIKNDSTTGIFTTSGMNKLGQTDIVASSAAINTTETVIVKTPALTANRLIAGTHFRIILDGTCTSTVANVSTFTVRWGTAGTTADGTVAALASSVAAASGTNNGFRAVIDVVVRVPGAAATSNTFLQLTSDGNIGIVATPNAKSVAGTAFNTTTALGILSVAYKSAAITTTSTFTIASIEIVDN